ncbi:YdcF family protein [Nocardiopsis rhodophaea]|uniref:YdcF family protein n=1 Tax=Nocardiopsis rhodophaea TaxID=280238 RepID=A0ABN2T2G0_9ACTN
MPDHHPRVLKAQERSDAKLIWDYHQMGHTLWPCCAAVVFGCHDIGVAEHAARLYEAGMFPVMVMTGASSPTTAEKFPEGEAVAYRRRAIELGVPAEAILTEERATNTGQNVEFSRQVLEENDRQASSLMLVTMPYMERRAYATCRKSWPEVEVVCSSQPVGFDEYVRGGDEASVVEMIVGDMQRVIEYPIHGFAIAQDVPDAVLGAYERLVKAGFDARLLAASRG